MLSPIIHFFTKSPTVLEESKDFKRFQMAGSSGYKEYVAGLLAGVATVITGHPFDTVKVKLQEHNTETHGIQYKNGLHCTARTLSTDGVLYRGATPSFFGMAFESSLLFGIYSQTKQILQCRMQVQGTDSLVPNSSRYTSPLDCALKTVKSEGVTAIFRGGSTTLLREALGNAVFSSIYENVRYYMHIRLKAASSDHRNLIDMGIGIVSGGLGGVAFWSAVLPLVVAKTIIQTDPDKNSTRNPFQILNSIYRRAGLKGCYAGLGPTIARAFPANAAAIVTWELAIQLLGIRHN
ncbi:mitochondrial arginine transporter BAC1-like isoform X4 [Mangifera indica]|uniref:mitochondrial arginine transporter BAC1-like isoform X4 n=1 Tax=Mangifera indica TaxID=29780 RepID=UPI001CF94D20|nr:mitochondrial arginine transporter BAC1-like isoform X4 [Mangifera indica]